MIELTNEELKSLTPQEIDNIHARLIEYKSLTDRDVAVLDAGLSLLTNNCQITNCPVVKIINDEIERLDTQRGFNITKDLHLLWLNKLLEKINKEVK